MNLLLTDPYTPQSYDIILSLKERCSKLVVACARARTGPALFSFSAFSRYVSKRYWLKSGSFFDAQELGLSRGDDLLPGEARYIEDLLEVCKRERIDTIYPSADEEVLLLSRHKQRFLAEGVTVAVNDFLILKDIMDKHASILLAGAKGVSCPQAILAGEPLPGDFPQPPWVIKPRFGNAARGMRLVYGRQELDSWIAENPDKLGKFVIQEFIPGDAIMYYRMYMDGGKGAYCVSCALCRRPEMLVHQTRGLMLEPAECPRCSEEMVSLLQGLGYKGYAHAQLKADSRDGSWKLMEFNARISRGTWTELEAGLNGPYVSLCLLKEDALPAARIKKPAPKLFVWPLQDASIFIFFLAEKIFRLPRGNGILLRGRLPRVKEMLAHYRSSYFNRRKKKICDNYFRNALRDPLVVLAYWLSFLAALFRDSAVRNRP